MGLIDELDDMLKGEIYEDRYEVLHKALREETKAEIYEEPDMIFHDVSCKLLSWQTGQPHVKEESLTDWLLYTLSQQVSWLKYLAFTRREEALNGADWEWWILLNSDAYRFRVQAKKLKPSNKDNWSSITYSNNQSTQIELLIDGSEQYGAYPLYLFYTIDKAEIEKQKIRFTDNLLVEMLEWCRTCLNGAYISSGYFISEIVLGEKKSHLDSVRLLNSSLGLSCFDMLLSGKTYGLDYEPSMQIGKALDELNRNHMMMYERYNRNTGFRYSYKEGDRNQTIPKFLSRIIEHNEIPTWLSIDRPHDLPDVDGLVILDLRSL